MRKKFIGVMLAATMAAGLAGCGGSGGTSMGTTAADIQTIKTQKEEAKDDAKEEDEEGDSEVSDSEGASDFHISITTGSISQSKDDRRGVGAFQAMYGKDVVKLAIYSGNFTEELKTTIQTIVNLSDDPRMKAIIINQSVPDVTEAFHKIKEIRPDILCIAGKGYEDLPETSSTADLACSNDFVARGYLIIRTIHELGYDMFAHTSFPRHMAYETMSHRVAVMKEACKEFGMEPVLEIAPGPTSSVGVTGAQAYVPERVPERVEKYGKSAACFRTNDARTGPLLKQLMKCDGYFTEADLPSPLMGYPGALGIDPAAEAGDFDKVSVRVESTIVERGGVNHLGTWTYSYGYITSADLVQHALNVLNGENELNDIDDIAKAYQVPSPKTE